MPRRPTKGKPVSFRLPLVLDDDLRTRAAENNITPGRYAASILVGLVPPLEGVSRAPVTPGAPKVETVSGTNEGSGGNVRSKLTREEALARMSRPAGPKRLTDEA